MLQVTANIGLDSKRSLQKGQVIFQNNCSGFCMLTIPHSRPEDLGSTQQVFGC